MACGLRTRMKYARAILSASEFTIPESSDKEYFSDDGWYFSNRIRYTGCRQYTAESAFTFGDETSSLNGNDHSKAEPALPRPGMKLELRLASRIDSTLSWGGDPVEAILVSSVRGTDGRPIPAGTVVRGHLPPGGKNLRPPPGCPCCDAIRRYHIRIRRSTRWIKPHPGGQTGRARARSLQFSPGEGDPA